MYEIISLQRDTNLTQGETIFRTSGALLGYSEFYLRPSRTQLVASFT